MSLPLTDLANFPNTGAMDSLLEDREVHALVASLARARGGEFSREDAVALVRWARRVRLDQTTLELCLKGCVDIDFDYRGEPRVRVTEDGEEAIRNGGRVVRLEDFKPGDLIDTPCGTMRITEIGATGMRGEFVPPKPEPTEFEYRRYGHG